MNVFEFDGEDQWVGTSSLTQHHNDHKFDDGILASPHGRDDGLVHPWDLKMDVEWGPADDREPCRNRPFQRWDLATGQWVTDYWPCGRNTCRSCVRWKIQNQITPRIAHQQPTHMFRIGLLPLLWAETRNHTSGFGQYLKRHGCTGARMVWVVETTRPDSSSAHMHGLMSAQIPSASLLSEAAASAGWGDGDRLNVHIQPVRHLRGLAYNFKGYLHNGRSAAVNRLANGSRLYHTTGPFFPPPAQGDANGRRDAA